jgi:hypothetical protein
LSAFAACFMSVTTGRSMWGMPIEGRELDDLRVDHQQAQLLRGAAVEQADVSITLSPTLLPAPVAPATMTWGMLARSA